MRRKQDIRRITGFVPCHNGHWDNNGGDYGGRDYFECLVDSDAAQDFGECSTFCPGYIPTEIKICKKHRLEYLVNEGCSNCFNTDLDREIKRRERNIKVDRWCELHLRFTIKVSRFDRHGCWILGYWPRIGVIDKFGIEGKWLFRGICIKMLRHSLILRIYCKGESIYDKGSK